MINKQVKYDLQDLNDIFNNNYMDFPLHIFPEHLRTIIKNYSSSFHVSQDVVASLMLPVIGGAIGNAVRIMPRQGWKEPSFIWVISVGRTGSGKTPVEFALMEPVERKELNGEEEFMTSDFTIPGLAEVFVNQPRGVITHRDEIAGFILGLDQYKKGKGDDRQHILSLWSANSWKINRVSAIKGQPRKRFIPNTGISILGGIQPKILTNVFTPDSFDDGLLPRFLFIKLEDKSPKFNKEGLDPSHVRNWHKFVEWFYGIPLTVNNNNFADPTILNLTSEALNIYEMFYNKYNDMILNLPDIHSAFIPKLRSYCLRTAGILHLIKQNNIGCSNTSINTTINVETMVNAIEVTQFFKGQAFEIIKLYGYSAFNEQQIRFIETLKKLQGEGSNGRLPFSRIVQTYNKGLSKQLQITDNRILGSIIREQGLTANGKGGNYYLIWEPKKIDKLFTKIVI